jgi:SAM-dependent methyltransferase
MSPSSRFETADDPTRQFWVEYQPGFRVSDHPIGSPAFFETVERERYVLEPDIPEMAAFPAWRDKDVLEAGCGIATDGLQFARGGARYTGLDFSSTALELARKRFELEGAAARFVAGSVTELPFPDASFDLVYSMGVIHHVPDTDKAVSEFHRVLRPGGRAIVMVYHRDSLNYRFTILVLRRLLAAALLLPHGPELVARASGERLDVLEGHRQLLRRHGAAYLRDRQLFLNNNTDGPGNQLSKVYSRGEGRALFKGFDEVRTAVRFLHLRSYPGGARLARTSVAERLGARWGWHLWIDARKQVNPAIRA